MADREYTNEELRMEQLRQQFLALSGDQDIAGRITFRGPNGEYVGEVKVSARDIEAVTDSLIALNSFRTDMEEATRPADPLPELDAEDADALMGEIEAYLGNGGQV
jgi:hypothetical protein